MDAANLFYVELQNPSTLLTIDMVILVVVIKLIINPEFQIDILVHFMRLNQWIIFLFSKSGALQLDLM